ncbi:hypothetical protein Acsp03_49010 [Actinomadura sp. NBRC 104412]|uniref:hypothetical protein n=1 Tax=Actinomadura sp. NBRC 104412 TaxID=3032203 RepID=UPI0024A13DA0|nr:hypothetical protein [Actinomadura sp. NBRC 104412]GLZ07435.1 hypothetical protein Acsp03_49010 [Actinomadura sp. NBRC 104412]
MVATPGKGSRRRPRRESALVWWAVFALWAVAVVWFWSWRLALLGLLLWCLYQFLLVPTLCRIMTRRGAACMEPVRGRLFACRTEHQRLKNAALWRLVGLKDPFRDRSDATRPDPNRETGQVVVSPEIRGRLDPRDRLLIALAAAGTLAVTIVMIYSYAVG